MHFTIVQFKHTSIDDTLDDKSLSLSLSVNKRSLFWYFYCHLCFVLFAVVNVVVVYIIYLIYYYPVSV